MEFVWDAAKNELLKMDRGVSFEEIVAAIEAGNLIGLIPNHDPTQPGRRMFVVYYQDYTWIVPYHVSEGDDKIVLHTAFKSRKMMKRFGYK